MAQPVCRLLEGPKRSVECTYSSNLPKKLVAVFDYYHTFAIAKVVHYPG